jgi:GMP synthase (glutamine-hydrolysing)
MRVLVVTHGPLAGPELFGDVVREQGHELVEWEIATAGTPPAAADAVLVLGGAQNVGEEVQHPWLRTEYDALRDWLERGTPLLGICLGAQTLAHALGADVSPLPARLAGFYDSRLTSAGASDAVLGVLPSRFDAFNANGYGFTVPTAATLLAEGPVPQAYRVGELAWGVQFHPEVRRDQLRKWFRGEGNLPRPRAELEREIDERLPRWQELGRRLARAFLDSAARS